MNEQIEFPEEKIPEVIKLIRLGCLHARHNLNNKREVSQKTINQMEKQCKQLEEYWNRK